MASPKKIVLAYSGGLDTSVCIKWLALEGYEVVAYLADVGQGDDPVPLRQRAMSTGATEVVIDDLRREFVDEYVLPALKANAVYQRGYLLGTALSRPLIAKHLVETAKRHRAVGVAHGCTGKGNDQVRFELTVASLAPELEIIAPVRVWDLKSREAEVAFAHEHNIQVDTTPSSPYSIDRNLWGVSIECGVLEDPWVEPPADAYLLTTDPVSAPDVPEYVEIYFERGVPKKLNGKAQKPLDLITTLNALVGAHGIGRTDLVEDRLVGIKSREVYEAPAACALLEAHQALEALVLHRDHLEMLASVSVRYSRLIYDGLWETPLRKALDAMISESQRLVTGTVRLKCYKGSVTVVGRQSLHSLYQTNLATYSEEDQFDHSAAEGFIHIYGLPYRGKST